jgi:hypothetical protein
MQSTLAGQKTQSSYFASRLTLATPKKAQCVNTMILSPFACGWFALSLEY